MVEWVGCGFGFGFVFGLVSVCGTSSDRGNGVNGTIEDDLESEMSRSDCCSPLSSPQFPFPIVLLILCMKMTERSSLWQGERTETIEIEPLKESIAVAS